MVSGDRLDMNALIITLFIHSLITREDTRDLLAF